MINIIYRCADLNDIPLIDKLNRECLPENYDVFVWISLLSSIMNRCILAFHKNELVGYCLGILSDKQIYIYSIAVRDNYRRRGIAQNMITKVMKDLNSDMIWLHVRKENTMARKLYEKLGMVQIQEIDRYYSDGEDALVYTRNV
jgi:[ribosomal protein S18]-alanine N-acetyltransferase